MALTLSVSWRKRERQRHETDKVELSETVTGLFGRHVG
jgi:hypothetical protein